MWLVASSENLRKDYFRPRDWDPFGEEEIRREKRMIGNERNQSTERRRRRCASAKK